MTGAAQELAQLFFGLHHSVHRHLTQLLVVQRKHAFDHGRVLLADYPLPHFVSTGRAFPNTASARSKLHGIPRYPTHYCSFFRRHSMMKLLKALST
jgi:hypothetical protein